MDQVPILKEQPVYSLYDHQNKAISELTQLYNLNNEFKGIVCIPTGGGKTHTAVIWGLQNFIAKGKKIIWLAHRHELLDQAYESFQKNAYSNYLPLRTEPINIRLVSSQHDSINKITGEEDVLIISNITFGKNVEDISNIFKGTHTEEVLLVIDEAHHAPAKTYRKGIYGCSNNFTTTLLGLTATPYRTLEAERGAMHRVFNDDIIYRVGLTDLIARGILSEPQIEDVKTNIDFKEVAKEYTQNLHVNDFKLPEKVSKDLQSKLDERNHYIVATYLKDMEMYGQTIIFTINRANAFALNELFKAENIKSNYIVSGDQNPTERARILNQFRNEEIEVLINVNILTEGTDVPNIQSVFLARPTMSPILLMQMMGRGLRGTAAGGTEVCYIRSFIDEWEDKVDWASPNELIKDKFSFDSKNASKSSYSKYVVEKEAIKAMLSAQAMDDDAFNQIVFINKVPVGFYHFSYTYITDEINHDKKCNVLVFCFNQEAYENFIDDLPKIIDRFRDYEEDTLPKNDKTVISTINEVITKYFKVEHWVKHEWIEDILNYYYQKEERPQFIPFEERNNYNIEPLARYIVNNDLGKRESRKYCQEKYQENLQRWSAFLGIGSEVMFINIVENEANRILDFEEGTTDIDPYIESQISSIEEVNTNEKAIDIDTRSKETEVIGEFESKFIALDELKQNKVKEEWKSRYEAIKYPAIKNIFFSSTESEVFGIPKTQEVISTFIDKKVEALDFPGIGSSKKTIYKNILDELRNYILSIESMSNQDVFLEDYSLSEEEKNFVNNFKIEKGHYPSFFLLSNRIENHYSDLAKNLFINNYFEIFKNKPLYTRSEISTKIDRVKQRVDQLLNEFINEFKNSFIPKEIRGLDFSHYKTEDTPIEDLIEQIYSSEKINFTHDFMLFVCSKLPNIKNTLSLLGNSDTLIFGVPSSSIRWSRLYLTNPTVKDTVNEVFREIYSILSTRYTDYEILDLQKNQSLVKLNESPNLKNQVLKLINNEGLAFQTKKANSGMYSPVPFTLTDNYIIRIHTANNSHRESLRKLFYEINPNTPMTAGTIKSYFEVGNEYDFNPSLTMQLPRYSQDINIILVAERWMTETYLATFVSIDNVKNKKEYQGRRKPSTVDIMVEMILFNNNYNGLSKAEWCDILNDFFKDSANIKNNNLFFLDNDSRYYAKPRIDLRHTINGSIPNGYYLKELED